MLFVQTLGVVWDVIAVQLIPKSAFEFIFLNALNTYIISYLSSRWIKKSSKYGGVNRIGALFFNILVELHFSCGGLQTSAF